MKRTIVLIAVMAVCAGILLAQTPPPAPKPTAEHQKLAAFVGNWTFDGEMKPGPMGPGGKMTGTDNIQWLGDFYVERRYQGTSPMGAMKGLEIIGYDVGKKAYTFSVFDSSGMMGVGTGKATGNNWEFTGTSSMMGKTTQDRCTLTMAADTKSMNIKCDMSMDGRTWMPAFEGKATKTR